MFILVLHSTLSSHISWALKYEHSFLITKFKLTHLTAKVVINVIQIGHSGRRTVAKIWLSQCGRLTQVKRSDVQCHWRFSTVTKKRDETLSFHWQKCWSSFYSRLKLDRSREKGPQTLGCSLSVLAPYVEMMTLLFALLFVRQ